MSSLSTLVYKTRLSARKLWQLLPEPDYQSAAIEELVAHVDRVHVRCNIERIDGWLSPREHKLFMRSPVCPMAHLRKLAHGQGCLHASFAVRFKTVE